MGNNKAHSKKYDDDDDATAFNIGGGGVGKENNKMVGKTSARMTQVGLKLLMEKALHFI